jgi:Fungal specific transcription factor domain/Fungal Zn(2)-Cys(6) binuclear cluster domain
MVKFLSLSLVAQAHKRSFTCKSRHTRCDENKSVCSNCQRLGLQCRASEFITHSAWSAVDGGGQSTTSTELSTSISSDLDVSLSSSVNSSDSPSRSTSLPSPKATAPTPRSSFVNLNDEAVHVLNVFRSGLATWMDIFDHDCTYQREVGRRALSSELLGRCICAFTAKHLSLLASGEVWRPVASRYYGEALNLLIKELGSPEPQSDALTAAMLLGSYEVLAAQDHEHQRHYQGAMKFINVRGIIASSVGLDKANFWIYGRHEISVALAKESPAQLDPRDWNATWPDAVATEDRMANCLMCLAGRAVNLTYDDGSALDRLTLIDDLERWYNVTSETFRGRAYGETNQEGLNKVHFAVPAAG